MAENLAQFERNVSTSFGYVKKDLIMINDSISELHDKIQHLSMNNAALMGKIAELENRISGKSKSATHKDVSPAGQKKAKVSSKKVSKGKSSKKKVIKETTLYE